MPRTTDGLRPPWKKGESGRKYAKVQPSKAETRITNLENTLRNILAQNEQQSDDIAQIRLILTGRSNPMPPPDAAMPPPEAAPPRSSEAPMPPPPRPPEAAPPRSEASQEPLSPHPDALMPGHARVRSTEYLESGGQSCAISEERIRAEAERIFGKHCQIPASELAEIRKKLAGEPYRKSYAEVCLESGATMAAARLRGWR